MNATIISPRSWWTLNHNHIPHVLLKQLVSEIGAALVKTAKEPSKKRLRNFIASYFGSEITFLYGNCAVCWKWWLIDLSSGLCCTVCVTKWKCRFVPPKSSEYRRIRRIGKRKRRKSSSEIKKWTVMGRNVNRRSKTKRRVGGVNRPAIQEWDCKRASSLRRKKFRPPANALVIF